MMKLIIRIFYLFIIFIGGFAGSCATKTINELISEFEMALKDTSPKTFDDLIFTYRFNEDESFLNSTFTPALIQVITKTDPKTLRQYFPDLSEGFCALSNFVINESIAQKNTPVLKAINYINPEVFIHWISFNAKNSSSIEYVINNLSLNPQELNDIMFAVAKYQKKTISLQDKVKLLDSVIEKGANVASLDHVGNTVVHGIIRWAPKGELDSLVTYFIKTKKFDPSTKNKKGQSVLDVAIEVCNEFDIDEPILALKNNGILTPQMSKKSNKRRTQQTNNKPPQQDAGQIGGSTASTTSTTQPLTGQSSSSNTIPDQTNTNNQPLWKSTPFIIAISCFVATAGKLGWDRYKRYKQKKFQEELEKLLEKELQQNIVLQ